MKKIYFNELLENGQYQQGFYYEYTKEEKHDMINDQKEEKDGR